LHINVIAVHCTHLRQDHQESFTAAVKDLDEAKGKLKAILDLEKIVANEVTEDHMIAAELGKKLCDVFPNIRTGYLVRKDK